jgi:hypothetical protein
MTANEPEKNGWRIRRCRRRDWDLESGRRMVEILRKKTFGKWLGESFARCVCQRENEAFSLLYLFLNDSELGRVKLQ